MFIRKKKINLFFFIIFAKKTMKPAFKSALYNLLFFAPIYTIFYFTLRYFGVVGFYVPLLSAFFTVILAPKFSTVKTATGEKIFMKVIFKKGVKEVK